MKREIVADNGAEIKSPKAPKSQERQLDEVMSYMVDQIGKAWRSQVFGELSQGTIEKFEDAQVGNYAKVYLALAKRATRKLLKRFDDKRLDREVKKILARADKNNSAVLYGAIENKMGIDSRELTNTEGLKANINALNLETSQWAKKLRDDTLEMYTANSLRAMSQGDSLESIMSQFDGLEEKRKNHAKFTARNQIANFNSITTKIRAQNLGIERAVWETAKDERVRGRPGGKFANAKPSHWDLQGREFDLSEGVKVNGRYILPGTDFLCRCTYTLIIPEE